MHSLLHRFIEIDKEAEANAQNPVLGPDEMVQFSLALSREQYTPEAICNIRWPDAGNEEKQILEQRMKQRLDWETTTAKYDALTERWQLPLTGNQQVAVPVKHRFNAEVSAKGRRAARVVEENLVYSMSINQYFATALVSRSTAQYGSAGQVWRFSIAGFEDGKWQPMKGAVLKDYQTSYLVQTLLYVLDGQQLRVFDTVRGELLNVNFYAECNVPPEVRFSSLRVNRAGVLLALGQGRALVGYAPMGQVPSFQFIALVEQPKAVPYSAIWLTPASGMEHELVLGREDGLLERWKLVLSSEQVQLNPTAELNLFQPKVSSQSNKQLNIQSGLPVLGAYQRGHRISAYTGQDWAILTQVPGVPQIYLKHPEKVPMVDMHVCGDMTAILAANGVLCLSTYVGSTPSQLFAIEELLLPPERHIPSGQQRVVMLPDIGVALLQNGMLVGVKLK